MSLTKIGGMTLNNCKIKNITEKNINNSQNSQENQFELIFESAGKTDTICLSGEGVLKVSATV